MFENKSFTFLVAVIGLLWFTRPAAAFGAGNIASISKVEGQNWRHGDIEDALLKIAMAQAFGGKKFNKLNVSRVYFGNWLRDYSQAIDVGTVKAVSAEAIRLLLCVLGFMTFGFGSKEFEVTADRLGCYRPEEHIDNPKNYADNVDARNYHRALRGPVDEGVELAIDPDTGMKNYIANERIGITTSAGLVRDLLTRCVRLGRSYARSGDKTERNESFRLMGTALHCLEDFFAHSNYIELALIELGERDVFPHVGRNTQINIRGARGSVYPIVTGTFGGVDFLHSVTGEVSDKLTQNEIEELEGTLQQSSTADTSILRNLLDKIPDDLFGGQHQSSKVDELQQNATTAQMQNLQVSPKDPEEYTVYVQNIFRQIMPVIEWHDGLMKDISNATDKIPVLPKILEQLEEQLSMFIFSLIAPFIIPIIHQIGAELKTGSEEIIQSSVNEQHIVFDDSRSTDPTHSMLSKDHFSNILNEVAGRAAAYTVSWVVPQVMAAIDDESVNVNEMIDRIVEGILHHPAQREMAQGGAREGRSIIFRCVEEWWNEQGRRQDEYRQKLSREGVQNGENHKEGVQDTGHGHGCAGKLKMRKQFGEPETWEDKVAGKAADAILSGASGAFSNIIQQQTGVKIPSYQPPQPKEEDSGIGGLLGAASSFLGIGGSGSSSRRQEDDQGYTQTQSSYQSGDSGYVASQTTQRYDNDGGYGRSETTERYDSGGGYTQSHSSQRYDSGGGYQQSQSSSYYQSFSSSGGRDDDGDNRRGGDYGGGYGGGRRNDGDDDRRGGGYGGGYGGRRDDDDDRRGGGYGGQRDDDDDRRGGGYGRRQEQSYGGDSYGGDSYGGDSYGGRQEGGYGGRQEGGYGGGGYQRGGYEQESYGGRREGGGGYRGRDDDSDDNERHGHRRQHHSRSNDSDDDDNHGHRQHHGRGCREVGDLGEPGPDAEDVELEDDGGEERDTEEDGEGVGEEVEAEEAGPEEEVIEEAEEEEEEEEEEVEDEEVEAEAEEIEDEEEQKEDEEEEAEAEEEEEEEEEPEEEAEEESEERRWW
ncbi:hypothetical protein SAPIO_CDS5488 [Scedosporium apiospermum]|uniref:Uncharacterized protein n=1 Tax=Pseudallescheria apiosperma TaxID=563466 RepID=A0A084G4R2_PSEDA|nr:uncharacterized protein SAPIO_CDS5488 [Scedosporium apiospermum]KEZ42324.1 hypothetical protein SAPIO_CDS5488 [Scedosporium apiospermum]